MNVACVLVDGDREYEVPFGTDAWTASMEWARFHGLDPMRIPAGSYVERDVAGRRVLFEEFLEDDKGKPVLVWDGDGWDCVTVGRVEQGEAPPMPFPHEVTG